MPNYLILLLVFLFSLTPPVAGAAPAAGRKSLTLTPETSVATAFLIAPGYLLTANHAVRGKQRLYVARERDRVFTAARVVGYSEELDIALIQASVKGEPMEFGQWQSFPKGAETFVVGFPKIGTYVSDKRITSGIFNGDQRFGGREDWFQLSAEIQRGNSGSPVIGPDGRVYGLISHKLDAQKTVKEYGDFPQNVNFALKSSRILDFLDGYSIRARSAVFDPAKELRPYEIFEAYEGSIFLLLGTNAAR